ncbi:hypothetical protein BV898_18418 [Hypsibius exemplaris]|uniref:Uncharacterized protein n=1 Tax=Hypsibius exemplaris TaxID=2072580 RepID=A0A9X6NHK0_HYPEX|nr:hypothetical protein BV898_18418 [Hypsibius exemplaris]
MGYLEVSVFVAGTKLQIGLRASRKTKSFRVRVQEILQLLAHILADHWEHYKPCHKDEEEKMVPEYLLKPENSPESFQGQQHAANLLDQRKAETAFAIGL